MNIRQAGIGDVQTIAKFNSAMALETENIKLNHAILTEGIKTVIEDSRHGYYLLLEIDTTVRACMMVTFEWSDWRNGQFWWIQSVYVDPEFRKQGCFKKLYQQLKQKADIDTACVGLRLYVESTNKIAQKTYRGLGMHKTGYHLFEYSKQPVSI